jgi:hypothetical protein
MGSTANHPLHLSSYQYPVSVTADRPGSQIVAHIGICIIRDFIEKRISDYGKGCIFFFFFVIFSEIPTGHILLV